MMAGKDIPQGWGLQKIYSHKKAKNKGGRVRKRGTYEEMMIEGENRKKSKLLKKNV